MAIKYVTEKPAEGRYVFLPDATTVISPDGIEMNVEPGEWPTDEEQAEHEGMEFFFRIEEWIPLADCKNGIYVSEEEYGRRLDELS